MSIHIDVQFDNGCLCAGRKVQGPVSEPNCSFTPLPLACYQHWPCPGHVSICTPLEGSLASADTLTLMMHLACHQLGQEQACQKIIASSTSSQPECWKM